MRWVASSIVIITDQETMSIETIKQLGLTDNEAKVYLACLELGQATVQELSKKSGVKRTTVYIAIEGLKEKGLVSQSKKAKKTMFAVESPDSLLALSQKRHEALKQALPELKSIYNMAGAEKPKLRFYEARQGYLTVYENILKDKPKELLAIASYDDLCHHLDQRYEDEWIEQRIKLGIKLRWLDFRTRATEKMQRRSKEELRELRFLPKNFKFTSSMFIYNDKIVLMSGRQKDFMAVVIESSEFCQMFKQLFEFFWQSKL